MSNLFESTVTRPLADRMRPESLGDVVGQDHLIGEAGPLGRMVANGRMTRLFFGDHPAQVKQQSQGY